MTTPSNEKSRPETGRLLSRRCFRPEIALIKLPKRRCSSIIQPAIPSMPAVCISAVADPRCPGERVCVNLSIVMRGITRSSMSENLLPAWQPRRHRLNNTSSPCVPMWYARMLLHLVPDGELCTRCRRLATHLQISTGMIVWTTAIHQAAQTGSGNYARRRAVVQANGCASI